MYIMPIFLSVSLLSAEVLNDNRYARNTNHSCKLHPAHYSPGNRERQVHRGIQAKPYQFLPVRI